MSQLPDLAKRLVVGRALSSSKQHEQLLPKRIALPVFASDALSSVAYAPQEILIALAAGGLAMYAYTPWIAAAVVVVLLTVVASYRQNVRAYPSGGGDFEVATTNLGDNWGVLVASALIVDYTLTVAVSVSSGVENLGALLTFIGPHEVLAAIGVLVVLTVANLRGLREAGIAFAIPSYLFMLSILGMLAWGLVRLASGAELKAETAGYELRGDETDVAGLALLFLLLRAFSSGCAALTGVESISNGVPAFRKPRGRNAATTLLLLGLLSMTMFGGVTTFAHLTGAKFSEPSHGSHLVDPATGAEVTDAEPVIAQVAHTVFSNFEPGFALVAIMTALILFLAANTAFNGFPVLGSVLAQSRYLPRQLHTRGDRLALSNGIIILAVMAGLLIYAYDASVSALIPLYTVGVFVSFTVSQIGMVRHWNRLLAAEGDPAQRRRMKTSRAINAFGATLTGIVLTVVLVSKFALGAYVVCVAMPVLFLLMKGIRRHYDRVAEELEPSGEDDRAPRPQPRHHPRLQGPQADAAGHRLRPRHPALHAGGRHGGGGRRGGPAAPGRVGCARPARPPEDPRLAVPGDHPPGPRLRQEHPPQEPPRRRHRVHPRVRRRPLVGAAAAQPERAAAEGQAAVPAGRHGDQRRVAAGVLPPAQGPHRAARAGRVAASAADRGAPPSAR